MNARWSIPALFILVLTLSGGRDARSQEDGPGKLELSGATHYLEKFEQRVARAHGAPFKLGFEDQEALKKVRDLKEKFPSHPAVEDLFQRARQALIASKGETFTVTPEMLAYRENEKQLVDLFASEAEKQWAAHLEQVRSGGTLIEKAFPAPGVRDIDAKEMIGKRVIIEEFEYPTNQFYDMGREFVFVGAGARGYYYVEIGNREWLGLYEAVKRYRRLINAGLPEGGMKWTVVGRITDLELLVPDPSKKKVGAAQWGWSVLPEAIYVPGLTFARLAPDAEFGGFFAGEERMQEIKSPLYSVREIPDDVTPERLTEIFATAIKEKNFDLYVECIDPERRKTPTAMSLLRYHWDLHQHRFREFYVAVTVEDEKTEITVLRGFDEKADDEGFFLDEAEKAKIRERSDPLVEEAVVWTKAWNERGLQYGSEKPHYLRRYEKKRWYINAYSYPY